MACGQDAVAKSWVSTEEEREVAGEQERWAVWVDVEGFSSMATEGAGDRALWILRDLMADLYGIGTQVFPGAFVGVRDFDCKRLFIHQFGDGFLISFDIGFRSVDEPLGVAIALMRSTASRGSGYLRASVSRGGLADIVGCYPDPIRVALEKEPVVRLGMGLMTINPVLGEGLVNAYGLGRRGRSGPLLQVAAAHAGGLDREKCVVVREDATLVEVDWLRSDSPVASGILETLGGPNAGTPAHVDMLRGYLLANPSLSSAWKEGAESLFGAALG